MIHSQFLREKLQGSDAKPLIYGHRGARGELPENTMPSIRHLVENGIFAVEIDVQNTADSVPILHHDPEISVNLAKDRNGDWLDKTGPKIIESTYSDLVRYDLGALKPGTDYQKKFPNQIELDDVTVPTLETFCEWLSGQPDFVANIEIKSYANRSDLGDSPSGLARTVINALEKHHVSEHAIISSFDWRVLTECRRLDDQITLGFLSYFDRPNPPMQPNIYFNSPWMAGAYWSGNDASFPRIVQRLGGQIWAPYFQDITKEHVISAQQFGLIVNVWTVNEEADILRMIDYGVDGIITDFPARTKALLSSI